MQFNSGKRHTIRIIVISEVIRIIRLGVRVRCWFRLSVWWYSHKTVGWWSGWFHLVPLIAVLYQPLIVRFSRTSGRAYSRHEGSGDNEINTASASAWYDVEQVYWNGCPYNQSTTIYRRLSTVANRGDNWVVKFINDNVYNPISGIVVRLERNLVTHKNEREH